MLYLCTMNNNLFKIILAVLLAAITAISGIVNNSNTKQAKKEIIDTLKNVGIKVIAPDTYQLVQKQQIK